MNILNFKLIKSDIFIDEFEYGAGSGRVSSLNLVNCVNFK